MVEQCEHSKRWCRQVDWKMAATPCHEQSCGGITALGLTLLVSVSSWAMRPENPIFGNSNNNVVNENYVYSALEQPHRSNKAYVSSYVQG